MTSSVRADRSGPVLTVTIDRPERRNALNAEVADGIVAAIDAAESDPAVRVVVLTGAGDRAFCAGGDLQPGAAGSPFRIDAADPRHYVIRLLRRMDACRLPLVARVNGHALAGGFGLVCACDLAVAREDARLGVPEVRIGLFPMTILPFMLRVLPYRRLMEMCLTGEPMTAAEAAAQGIVNRAVPAEALDETLARLVDSLLAGSPTAVRLGKQGLRQVREAGMDQALEYAQFMLANMARTDDAAEGFAAFNEKRPPRWTGR